MCNLITEAARLSAVSRRDLLKGTGAAAAASLLGFNSAQALGKPPAHAGPSRHGHSKSRTRVVLLGTAAGPVWWRETERHGPATAIVVEDAVYLVDCGEGVGARYRQAGLGPDGFQRGLENLEAIFITHMHSDHTIDYPNMPIFAWTNGIAKRTAPVMVYGPGDRGVLPPVFGDRPEPPVIAPSEPTPGIEAMTEHLYAAYATDLNDRMRDNGAPDPHSFFTPKDIPLPNGIGDDPNNDPSPEMDPILVHEDARVRVTATLVDHSPAFPSFGYRFDTDDGSVVVSGDTNANANLIRLAKDTDILVHEVIDRQWVEGLFPTPHTPQQEALIGHLLHSHTSIEEVGAVVAEDAGAKTLVLTHLAPTINPARRWRAAAKGYSGKLVVGEDLMQIGLARSRRRTSR